jgi:uncharacterized protein (DUF983 family)
MESAAHVSTAYAILHQLCPRCYAGKIYRGSVFAGFPKMHDCCPVCGLRFEREEGYFLGAMYISYTLALITIVVFGLLLRLATHWMLSKVTLSAILLFLPTAPALTLFSRVLWIYLDRAIDPEQEAPRD